MMMHPNIPKDQWNAVKSEIKKTWNRLDPVELEGTQGDAAEISKLVQKRYGLNENQVDRKLDEVIERCGTAAGPATFRNATSAGSAEVGSNVDPSSLSAQINQDSSLKSNSKSMTTENFQPSSSSQDFSVNTPDEQDEDVHASSFNAPEEGLDSAQALIGSDRDLSQRDSREPEDFNTLEPKRFGSSSSKGSVNESESRFKEGQAGNSERSQEVSKSARDSSGSKFASENSRNRESESSPDTRYSEDSPQEE